jgi:hypothetical protein
MKELEKLERAEHSYLTTWAEKNPDFVIKHGVANPALQSHEGLETEVGTD